MDDKLPHIDPEQLILRYLAGEASSEEKRCLIDAIENDVAVREKFHQLKHVYRASLLTSQSAQFNQNKAFESFMQHTQAKQPTRVLSLKRIISIAAVVLLLLGVGATMRFWPHKQKSITSSNATLCSSLPDGSKLYLNRLSDVDYPEQFDDDKRQVSLHGEAFFEIKHNEESPFSVLTDDVRITVLGTKFDVRNYSESILSVVVNEGCVRVETINGNQQCTLHVGERADYDRTLKKLTKSRNTDPNYRSWQNGLLVFDDMAFGKVVETLSRHYAQDISVDNPALNNCRLTAKYQNYSLDKILGILTLTFNINVSQKDSTYRIDGAGCDF